MVEGIVRAQQQVGLALREPLGSDRFHPEWGSTLPEYIGTIRSRGVPAEIRAEVNRVIRDYIINQNEAIRRRAAAGLRPTITAEEMVMNVNTISVQASQDSISVKVVISTASNKEFAVLTTPGKTS